MKPSMFRMLLCRAEMRAVWLAAGLALTAVGCNTLKGPSVASGVPESHRLAVEPFLIFTSYPLADNDPVVRELLSLREQVHDTLGLPVSARPIEIYVFDDRPSYERFIQKHYPDLPRRRAFFIAQDQREVVYAFRDEKLAEDLRHEACHALMHAAVGAVPLWLDEGLAEYFETPGRTDGLHPRHLADLSNAIGHGWRPGLTRLESLTQVGQMTNRDYCEAWAWVYFLLQGSPDGRRVLLSYLGDLRTVKVREPLSVRLFAVIPWPDVAMVAMLDRLEPIATTSHDR